VATQHDPIKLETAGELLGGEEPYSRKTVERIIDDGLLPDYGSGANRRVLRGHVEVLIERLATGEVVWPPGRRKKRATREVMAPSTSTRKVAASGMAR
jgi:hypothetical protein